MDPTGIRRPSRRGGPAPDVRPVWATGDDARFTSAEHAGLPEIMAGSMVSLLISVRGFLALREPFSVGYSG